MKKHLFLILFCLLFLDCLSQQIIKGKLTDATSNEPIQYANISIINSELGTYSNAIGYFELEVNDISGSLNISMIGYKSLIVEIENLNLLQVNTILLSRRTYELEEIAVVANKKIKPNTKNLGYINNASNVSLSGRSKSEIAVFIDNSEYKSAFIKEVIYEIKRNHVSKKNKQKQLVNDKRFENFKTAIRVHLYTKDSIDGKPDKELLKESIVIILDEKFKDKLKVDISKYNILLPEEGVFVGLEWLGLVDEITGNVVIDKKYDLYTSISLTNKIEEKRTWMKHAAYNQDWGQGDMEVLQKLNNYNILNAVFGITVEMY